MRSISTDPRLIRYANDHGYSTYESVVVVEEQGVPIGISIGDNGGYLVSMAVEPLVWDEEMKDTFDDTFWGLGTSSYDEETGFITAAISGGNPQEQLTNAREAAARFPRALGYARVLPRFHCHFCGRDACDNAVVKDGLVYPAHAACAPQDEDGSSKTVRFAKPNQLLAAAAALFAGIFSTMLTFVIVIKGGSLVDMLYLALPFCAAVAYDAARGKKGTTMYVTVTMTSYLSALFTLVCMFYLVNSLEISRFLPIGMFFELLLAPGSLENFLMVTGRVLLFTTVGLAGTFYLRRRSDKARAVSESPSLLAFVNPIALSPKLLKPAEVPSAPAEEDGGEKTRENADEN